LRITSLLGLTLVACLTANADFSYSMTSKTSGAISSAPQSSKYYYKVTKSRVDTGHMSIITDFDAQTITSIDNNKKTYSVMKFSDLEQMAHNLEGSEITVDVKETGQRRKIGEYAAKQTIMTMDVDPPQGAPPGAPKMQVEMEFWTSEYAPGATEMLSFNERNLAKYPFTTLANNPGLQKPMLELQRHMAKLRGTTLLQIMRMRPAMGPPPKVEMTEELKNALKELEQLRAQNPELAERLSKNMPGAPRKPGAIFETTMEAGEFSNKPIPDSMFAIPEGYANTEKKN
jgi:hypothetical protein